MKNIVLIGMPGCGKSTIGKILSREIGSKFIDLDEYIVEINNMTIDEMFQHGEEFFRDKETKVAKAAGKARNAIISTGGGIIKRNKNMVYLKDNGFIIFIDRSPEKIIETIDNLARPLLKAGKERIYNLYDERINLYNKYCDIKIDNNGDIEQVIFNIKSLISQGIIDKKSHTCDNEKNN